MSLRLAKWVAIIALALYLAGPVFETVDRWDNFQEQSGDIALSATTAATVLAAAVCFALAQRRRLSARPAFAAIRLRAHNFMKNIFDPLFLRLPRDLHWPPLTLRI